MNDELADGVRLFNSGSFWHAHEAWEVLWLRASGDEKTFLQGLIQVAAAYHHVQRGTLRGAPRLFDAALAKLSRVPDGFLGIDRGEVVARAAEHRVLVGKECSVDASDFPKLRYN